MNPRTVAALTQLPDLVADLETELVDATPEPSSASGKPTSRPPLSLPVVSDIDEAWRVVATWAQDWCETYGLTGPPAPWTWPGLCRWLAEHYATTAADHPALDEFDDEIGCQRRHLRRHLHEVDVKWRPLPGRWHCPLDGCDGKLMQHTTEPLVRCDRCEASWTETEYELLGRMLGQEYAVTVDQAAAWAKVHRRTINRWIALDILPTIVGTPRLVDRRDVAALLIRREA